MYRLTLLAIALVAIYLRVRAELVQRELNQAADELGKKTASALSTFGDWIGYNAPSANFTWRELDPKSEASAEQRRNLSSLAKTVLEPIRSEIGKPLIVTPRGGFHGPSNTADRLLSSQHRAGRAADIRARGYTSEQLYDVVVALTAQGTTPVGYSQTYPGQGFVHVDTGPRRGRRFKADIAAFRRSPPVPEI